MSIGSSNIGKKHAVYKALEAFNERSFFFQPCRCYLKSADVQFMFVEMLTKTEQQFLGFVDSDLVRI